MQCHTTQSRVVLLRAVHLVTWPVTLQVKEQIILSATEAAEMILRVDDIIKCAPRQRAEE